MHVGVARLEGLGSLPSFAVQTANVRRLVLTHFSQRYQSTDPFYDEAHAIHDDVVVAKDCKRIEVPKRPFTDEPGAQPATDAGQPLEEAS